MDQHEAMWDELGLDVPLHQELQRSLGRAFQETVGSQVDRPQAMKYFDEVLHQAHGGRVAELVAERREGRKTVGTFCIFVPDEVVMAVDLHPVPLCGGTQFSIPYAERMFPRDICPLVKSTLGLAFSRTCPYAPLKAMAIGETTCDSKKKTWEILSGKVNFQVMEVPQKKRELDRKMWRQEVEELVARVEDLSGRRVSPENLARAIRIMNRKRRALQELTDHRRRDRPPISGLDALVVMQAALSDEPVRFTDRLDELNQELARRVDQGCSPFPQNVKRIMISGCPSVSGNWKIHSLIERAGGAVVVDETCTGTRYFEHLVDETEEDLGRQLDAISERYLKINCACFTPNDDRVKDALRLAKAHQVGGVVHYVLQYCHAYNIEAIKLSSAFKQEGIPTLKIETDYSEEDLGPLRTRIDAFLERLG